MILSSEHFAMSMLAYSIYCGKCTQTPFLCDTKESTICPTHGQITNVYKANTVCKHGDKCWSVTKGTCGYKHNKSVIPCVHGSKCWSVKNGKCPYKH